MIKENYGIFAIGLIAQLLFSARLLIQWVISERKREVLSPTSFWITSIIASILLMIYGVLRQDLVIIGGQLISYFIYLRNLQLKNLWGQVPFLIKWLAVFFPFFAILWLIYSDTHSITSILESNKIPGLLMIWGGLGQVVFTFRFVYQWYYSERRKISFIPIGFWVISLAGSLMIITYAIYRRDPVLIIGQLFGVVAYSRNLYLGLQPKIKTYVVNQ